MLRKPSVAHSNLIHPDDFKLEETALNESAKLRSSQSSLDRKKNCLRNVASLTLEHCLCLGSAKAQLVLVCPACFVPLILSRHTRRSNMVSAALIPFPHAPQHLYLGVAD